MGVSRYLIAEYWSDGVATACWTSEDPGRTGPADLERIHGAQARWWWKPYAFRWLVSSWSPVDFWCYRWARRRNVPSGLSHSGNPASTERTAP